MQVKDKLDGFTKEELKTILKGLLENHETVWQSGTDYMIADVGCGCCGSSGQIRGEDLSKLFQKYLEAAGT